MANSEDLLICSKCNETNPIGSKYCIDCGSILGLGQAGVKQIAPRSKPRFVFQGFIWKSRLWNKVYSEIQLKWTFVITITLLAIFLIEVIARSSFYYSFILSIFPGLAVFMFEGDYSQSSATEKEKGSYNPLIILIPLFGPLLVLIWVWRGGGPHLSVPVRKDNFIRINEEIPDSLRRGSKLDAYEEIMGKSFESKVQQGDEFELFCAFLLEKEGYIIEKIEGGSFDRGTDIRVRTPGVFGAKISVQCKHYIDRTVGSNVIQTSMGALHLREESFDQVAVMTSGTFTKAALAMATANNVKLIDNTFLKKWSKKHLVGISLSEILQRGQIWVG
jgi:hypothetical protein